MINELAKFKGKFNFLRENSEKYITFSVPIEKKVEASTFLSYDKVDGK